LRFKDYCATFVLLKGLHNLKIMNEINLSPEVLQDIANKLAEIEYKRKFPEPNLNNFRLGEFIGRTIWNKIHWRPKDEHLHEFIFQAMGWTLGNHWIEEQMKMPLSDRHVIMKWTQSRYDFLTKIQKQGYKLGELVIPTGEVRELMSLAADMYFLQIGNELPKNLVKRLKSYDGFQGARFEIAVAASLVRAGFTVQWTDSHNSKKKIHEFDAYQIYTKETIAIEAKLDFIHFEK